MYRCNKVTEKHVILFVSTNSNIGIYRVAQKKTEQSIRSIFQGLCSDQLLLFHLAR